MAACLRVRRGGGRIWGKFRRGRGGDQCAICLSDETDDLKLYEICSISKLHRMCADCIHRLLRTPATVSEVGYRCPSCNEPGTFKLSPQHSRELNISETVFRAERTRVFDRNDFFQNEAALIRPVLPRSVTAAHRTTAEAADTETLMDWDDFETPSTRRPPPPRQYLANLRSVTYPNNNYSRTPWRPPASNLPVMDAAYWRNAFNNPTPEPALNADYWRRNTKWPPSNGRFDGTPRYCFRQGHHYHHNHQRHHE
jgi:hypothetical protein